MNNSILRKPFTFKYFNAVMWLIGVNVFFFFITMVAPTSRAYLQLNPLVVLRFKFFWQFLTYMFVHSSQGFTHILFNMLALLFFGTQVERKIGSYEFILFYLIVGIFAGIFSFFFYLVSGVPNVNLLGASGAVYGVLMAFATYFPDSRIYIWGIFPVKSTYLVIGFACIEIFSQLFRYNSGIAHLTHLAGFAFAFLYFILRVGINPIDSFRGPNRQNWS